MLLITSCAHHQVNNREDPAACNVASSAVSRCFEPYSDGGDCKPAWKISPGVGLNCYLEKDARKPQEWAVNKRSPEVVPRVRQR